jgi:hypothetical protein
MYDNHAAGNISPAERRRIEREKLLRDALIEQFPELSKQEIVEKEKELRLIVGQQLKTKTPTSIKLAKTDMELAKAQDERWYDWIGSSDHTYAELWIGIEIHFWLVGEEMRALKR